MSPPGFLHYDTLWAQQQNRFINTAPNVDNMPHLPTGKRIKIHFHSTNKGHSCQFGPFLPRPEGSAYFPIFLSVQEKRSPTKRPPARALPVSKGRVYVIMGK